ncbi:MAG TPA: PHP domain-containing protein, partial [Ktedonobacterales bacterium]
MSSITPDLILAADAAIDLQMHTTFSDGVWTPAQLVDYLMREGFALAAITDHERIDMVDELQRIAAERGFPLLVAAEMSAAWRGEPTDTLCFGFDPQHPALRAVAQEIAQRQGENTRKVWEYVRAQGKPALAESELERILTKPSAQQP